jgi:hypothetical protein
MTAIDVSTPRPQVLPILDTDVDDVASYLHARMDHRVAAARWGAAMNPTWQHDPPNHGFHLRCDGTVVGAYLALYSQRATSTTAVVRFCNLAAWCVDPEFRFSGMRLLRALLAQEGYVFTDLSPSGNVIALNERLGFRHVDTATAVVTCVPYPILRRTVEVTSEPERIAEALSGRHLRTYLDHRASPAVKHLLVDTTSGSCHVMFRRDRRRDLPLFASILHASDRDVFSAQVPAIGRHLLLHHGVAMLLCPMRLLARRPARSFMLESPRPKMFNSDIVGPDDIDDLYSELTELSW